MKAKILNIIKFIVFLVVGLSLLWLVYKDQIGYSVTQNSIDQIKKEAVPELIITNLESIKDIGYYTEKGLNEAIQDITKGDQNSFDIIRKNTEYRMQKTIDALHETKFVWIWISLIVGIFSHVIRAFRWKMLLKPLGHTPTGINTFFAVMVGYLANLAIPRLGEVSRCGVLRQYEKVPFAQSFGTVVVERVFDMICLLVLLLVTMIFQFNKIVQFFEENPEVGDKFSNLFSSPLVLLVAIGVMVFVIVLFIVLRHKIRNAKPYQKAKELIISLFEGIKTIWKLENKWLFIFYSVLIWLMYYLMTYLCFFSFEFTSHLSPLAALTVFVMASFGMVAPVQGGIGPWHYMASRTLAVYGIAAVPAAAFALVVHSAQTLMLVVVGLISLVALPVVNRNKKLNLETSEQPEEAPA